MLLLGAARPSEVCLGIRGGCYLPRGGWLVESFHRREAIFTETMNCLLKKHPFDIDEAEADGGAA